jgi:hypothetical protein
VIAEARARDAAARAGPFARPLALALLFAGAAGFSALIILKGMQPNDEGLMLEAAARIADGEVPYRDFWWYYPPGQPYLLAGLWELFGPSLLTWRIVRVLTNGAVALLAYLLARQQAPRGIALLAWATATIALAAPTGPHPYPVALAFALGCLLALERSPVLAGVLAGLCGVWRIEFAAYLGAGVLLGYALRPGSGRARAAARFAAAAIGAGAVLFAPVVLEAGLGRSWDLLIRYPLQDFGDYQSLPFPGIYGGALDFGSLGAARDTVGSILSFEVPLLLMLDLAAVLAVLALRFRRARWRRVPIAVFAVGMAHYLLARPDAFHVGPLAVTLAVPSAWILADVRRLAGRGEEPGALRRLLARARAAPPRVRASLIPVPVVAFALAWVLADGLQRYERQVQEDMVPIELEVADGARELPSYNCSLPGAAVQICTLADLERAVRFVRGRVPPDEPIYVGTQRADLVTSGAPILYVLAGRPSATRYHIAAPGVVTSAPVQREIVRELEDAGLPLVIRWTASITAAPEPNRAGRSTGVRILDVFLARRYRRTARFGSYVILERRS